MKFDKRTNAVILGLAAILILTAGIFVSVVLVSLLVTPEQASNASDDEGWTGLFSTYDEALPDEADDDDELGDAESINSSFLVLSDVHLDLSYMPTKGPNRFCRDESKHGPSEECYSSRFDHDDDSNYAYGQYGCDSPLPLLSSALAGMREVTAEPAFILLGGDLAAHCSDSYETTRNTVANATAVISSFFPDAIIIPTVGNNDVFPQDQLPYGMSQQLSDLTDIWSDMLGTAEAVSTFRQGGFFSRTVLPNLRVLSFNSLYYTEDWCPNNVTLCTDEEIDALVREDDPQGQFSWMEEQILDAINSGQELLLTSHMSPGRTRGFGKNWRGQYQKSFLELVQRYHEHILGHFFGHVHRDELMIYAVEEASELVNLSSFFVNSAVSPREKQNPVFREVNFHYYPGVSSEDRTVVLDDYRVHYLNLSSVFELPLEATPTWTPEYDFGQTYREDGTRRELSLSETDVQTAVGMIIEDEEDYELYLDHWGSLSDEVVIKHSKAEYVCSLTTIKNSAYNDCLDLLYEEYEAADLETASSE